MSGVAVAAGYLDNLKREEAESRPTYMQALKSGLKKHIDAYKGKTWENTLQKFISLQNQQKITAKFYTKTGFFSSGKNDVRRQQKKLV